MKWKGIHALCLVVLLSAGTQAVTIPVNLPEITVSVSPQNPTSADAIRLSLAGTWPDSCVPESLRARTIAGDSVWVDLLLPGADDEPCDNPACAQVISSWQTSTVVGTLAAGIYDVYARAVACDRVGSFELIGQFRVGLGTGGGDGDSGSGRFQVGDRVVLLEDNPPGGAGLAAGSAGTIVCMGGGDCPDCLLISWDSFQGGRDEVERCSLNDLPVLVPPNSAIWVRPSEVLLGQHFTACGTVRQGLEGCILFETAEGRAFNVVDDRGWLGMSLRGAGPIRFGDRVRLRGALNTTPPGPDVIRICPQRDGDIYNPILSLCAPATGGGCCNANYRPGDRVILLVDNPLGSSGQPASLRAGARGTVVCCDADDPRMPVFVSWDGFTGGRNDDFYCDPPVIAYPENSGWWMACSQIAPLTGGDPGPCPDDGLIIDIGGRRIRLIRDLQCPTTTFTGCADVTLQTNFRLELQATVTPEEGVTGDWEAWVTPDVVGPGTATVKICVRATNVDLTTIPPGKDILVARLSLLGRPATE